MMFCLPVCIDAASADIGYSAKSMGQTVRYRESHLRYIMQTRQEFPNTGDEVLFLIASQRNDHVRRPPRRKHFENSKSGA